MVRRLVVALIAVLLVGSCASDGETRYAADLCTFKERKEPAAVAYTDKRGDSYLGEPNGAVYKDESEVASAVATPREPIYKYEARSDCFNAEGKFYYPCTLKHEVDLSRVQAVGRATSLDKAEALARSLCQQRVNDLVIKKVGRPQVSMATTCVVQYGKFCSLKDLPKGQPTDAKPERLRWY
jgi:hypothetical protein